MLRSLFVRLRAVLRPTAMDRGIGDELAYHLDREIERNVAQGMTPVEARDAARRAFGNVSIAREDARAAARPAWLDQLGQDVRYAIRAMVRSPGFTLAVVLSLGLGMGATGAVFGLIDALVLRPLPVRRPERLVMLKRDEPALRSYSVQTQPDLERYRGLTDVFAGVAGIVDMDRANLAIGGALDPRQVRVALVSGEYFGTLGVRPIAGRLLEPADDGPPGSSPVAVISDAFWATRFARSRGAVGRTFKLGTTTYTVVGVAPRGFTSEWVGHATDLWLPLSMFGAVNNLGLVGATQVQRVVARLRDGVTAARAQAAVDVVAPQLARAFATANPQVSVAVAAPMRLRIIVVSGAKGFSPQRDALGPALRIMMLIAALLLLIAAANVANLVLARSAARRRELAVRMALGAGMARLVRQLLTESVLLSALGGAFGVAFHEWATRALLGFVGSAQGGMTGLGGLTLDVRPSPTTVAFSALVCMVVATIVVAVPSLRLPRARSRSELTQRGTTSGGARFGVGRSLVTSQIALSVTLLVVAALLVRTLRNLRSRDLGYERHRMLLLSTFPSQTNRRSAEFPRLADDLLQRLRALPGVNSASISSAGLLNGIEGNFGGSGATRLEGRQAKPGLSTTRSAVAPGFFAAAGLRLIDGRDFGVFDTDSSPPVAILNETFARFLFPGERAIGKHIGVMNDAGTPREIVGVVSDAKYNTAREEQLGMLYLDYRQRANELGNMTLVVRTNGAPSALAARVRAEVRALDPTLPIVAAGTLDDQLDLALVRERLLAALAVFFGVLAALLACVGLYGIVSYTVSRRTGEIGIRLALGASPGHVLRMIAWENVVTIAIGIALGVPVAVAAARVATGQLYGLSSVDPLTIVAASGLLAGVAFVAGVQPARRAARVGPMVALRSD